MHLLGQERSSLVLVVRSPDRRQNGVGLTDIGMKSAAINKGAGMGLIEV